MKDENTFSIQAKLFTVTFKKSVILRFQFKTNKIRPRETKLYFNQLNTKKKKWDIIIEKIIFDKNEEYKIWSYTINFKNFMQLF
jgi:hypothetical protein